MKWAPDFFHLHSDRGLFDVDGVCARFHDKARVVIKEVFNLDLPIDAYVKWDVTSVLPTQEMKDRLNAMIAEPGFATTLEPYAEAQSAIREIRRLIPIKFVTTPHPVSKTWMREREEWLIHRFGATHREITQTYDKAEVCGGFLVEDKPQNARKWAEHHPYGIALLWDQPYNRDPEESAGLRRVTSWEEVLDVAKQISKG